MALRTVAPRDKRFTGNNKHWSVKCSQCGCLQAINTNKARPIPPNIITKKLKSKGWYIDNNPKRDLCPECYHKPIKATVAIAAKALTQAAAPMVGNGMHFSELTAVVSKLEPKEAKQLMDVLRKRIPPPQPRERKPERKYDDSEYEQWLENLCRTTKDGSLTP
jgi:hypothetical protein